MRTSGTEKPRWVSTRVPPLVNEQCRRALGLNAVSSGPFCVMERLVLEHRAVRAALPLPLWPCVPFDVECSARPGALPRYLPVICPYLREPPVHLSRENEPQRDSTTLASVLRGAETGKGGLKLVGVRIDIIAEQY